MVKALLCDFDGTILNTVPFIVQAYKHTLKDFGFTLTTKEIVQRCMGHTEDDICEAFGIREKTISFKEMYLSTVHMLTQSAPLFPNVLEIILLAKKQNIKLGIITVGYRQGFMKNIKRVKLEQYFESIVCFDDVKHTKPDPEAVYLSCNNLQVAPDSVMVIGDSASDIKMGINAGTETVLFLPESHCEIYDFTAFKELKPDHIIADWNELQSYL